MVHQAMDQVVCTLEDIRDPKTFHERHVDTPRLNSHSHVILNFHIATILKPVWPRVEISILLGHDRTKCYMSRNLAVICASLSRQGRKGGTICWAQCRSRRSSCIQTEDIVCWIQCRSSCIQSGGWAWRGSQRWVFCGWTHCAGID